MPDVHEKIAADYVVVGAGSAGCALAYRLAESGQSVLLIEHGGSDIGPFIQMPAALSYPMNMNTYDWGFETQAEPYLDGRQLPIPRGKVVGGSSSINGMCYVRGHAYDFDAWAEGGAKGWSYADVLPYFMRMENWHDPKGCAEQGETKWRGSKGPLHVTRGAQKNPLMKAFEQAGGQAGYPVVRDYNGHQQEGFCGFDATIWKGRRWSVANAYLKPALKRANCDILRAFVHKVVFEKGVAVGVEVTHKGQQVVVQARKEVILSASALNSPKILMLSGIGPKAQLAEHGIPVLADRAGVGHNLQDHLELYIQYAAIKPVSLFRYWNIWGKALIGAQWLFTKTGLGASNQFETVGFIRSKAGVSYPDIQFHFLPIAVRYDGQAAAQGHGFQAHVGPMRSKSRGCVTLKSADPQADPSVRFNYMSDPSDWEDFRACIRLTREIFGQEAFAPYRGEEIQPGHDVQSDEDLDAFIREHVESAYHPCGTCKMGDENDPNAVVDAHGRVIGVSGLRVADSSIFPSIPNGNLNAPSIMVGEKIADHILQRTPLAPLDYKPWVHPDWENAQR